MPPTAAEAAAGRQPHVEAVLADVIAAAANSVQRTPTLLPVLEDAGVVDSGGQGLYRILEGALQVGPRGTSCWPRDPLARRRPAPGSRGCRRRPWRSRPTCPRCPSGRRTGTSITATRTATRPSTCWPPRKGASTSAPCDAAISAVGDSVVVAGDERLVRVHVHGERPDEAIAAGLRFGRLSEVGVRDLDDQVAHHATLSPAADGESAIEAHLLPAAEAATTAHANRTAEVDPVVRPIRAREVAPVARLAPPIAIVAVAEAAGLARALESLGARVVHPAHGSRPSVGEIAEGILAVGSGEVIVLPNDRDALLAARHAARADAHGGGRDHRHAQRRRGHRRGRGLRPGGLAGRERGAHGGRSGGPALLHGLHGRP